MSIYVVTGKLGAGKTLAAVGRIRDTLLSGRPVATNLDLNLEKMLPAHWGQPKSDGSRAGKPLRVVRIPDKPDVSHLQALGLGNPTPREEENGLIVLDELGAWLNTRQFQDKGRSAVIDWLLHSRKLGWDVIFIIQHANMVDKQIREGLAEFLVTCRRTDKLRIPFIGPMIGSIIGWEPRPPKVHIGTVRYGLDKDALVVDRWYYRGRDLYEAYDTRQVFTENGQVQGPASMLTPWHLRGRYLRPGGATWWVRAYGVVFQGRPFRPRPAPTSEKHRLARLLGGLPPEQRLRHFRRLESLGAFGCQPVAHFNRGRYGPGVLHGGT